MRRKYEKEPRNVTLASPNVLVILGPTSSGKSELGVKIAKWIERHPMSFGTSDVVAAEIISADSRQVYRGMDIGSGKVTQKEMEGVPHYLLDIASPRRTFTVAQYQKHAKHAVKSIVKRAKLPIVVGGTAFYIDALIYDYTLPKVTPDQKLRKRLEKKSGEELLAELTRLDPHRAQSVDRKNKRRLIRALEIVHATGDAVPPMPDKQSPYRVLKIGITLTEAMLKSRINKRLRRRLDEGMLKEVEQLHSEGISWERLDSFGLEYRYASRHLRGLITKEEMIASIERDSSRYAKSQMRWWKKDKSIHWVTDPREAFRLVQKFIEI